MEKAPNVVSNELFRPAECRRRIARRVGRDDHIVVFPDRMVRLVCLRTQYIQTDPGNFAAVESSQESFHVDDIFAGDTYHVNARFHQVEFPIVDEVFGIPSQRYTDVHPIGLGKQVVQDFGRMD